MGGWPINIFAFTFFALSFSTIFHTPEFDHISIPAWKWVFIWNFLLIRWLRWWWWGGSYSISVWRLFLVVLEKLVWRNWLNWSCYWIKEQDLTLRYTNLYEMEVSYHFCLGYRFHGDNIGWDWELVLVRNPILVYKGTGKHHTQFQRETLQPTGHSFFMVQVYYSCDSKKGIDTTQILYIPIF